MEIELLNASKLFNKAVALKDVSFSLSTGRLSLITGPNGAGKTTLFRIITKEYLPSKGDVKYGSGINSSEIAFSDENRDVFQYFSPKNYCRLWQLLYPRFDKNRFMDLIKSKNIPYSGDVSSFSKGRKTWLFNSLSISSNSKIVIMDEPFQHLDPVARDELRNIFKTETEKGRAIIVSTHEISEFDEITDDIVILCEGNLLYSGDKVKTFLTHRVIPGTDCEDDCQVIGPIVNEKLVVTEKNTGRTPILKEIVLGYLNGYQVNSDRI